MTKLLTERSSQPRGDSGCSWDRTGEKKKEDNLLEVLTHGIRRRPSLPGGFPPSTLSVLRLNYCVRDGNRWDPQAIVTGNCIRLCSLQDSLRPPLSLPARSPLPAPFLFLRRLCLPLQSASLLPPLLFLPLPHLQNCTGAQALALASPTLDHVPALRNRFFSLLRSSPRPISIIKLHTLPHFHR